ncbi:MAG: PASTA domain-containing protein [Bacteroidaceae bacterium]|jgi:cell division protein FtsI (penicillin-binding protein 3)|nr:PASTA domain-containing protein [Bacteroidaceae bacterium]
MKFEKEHISSRFTLILGFVFIGVVVISVRMIYIMTVKRDYWKAKSEEYVRDSVVVPPNRGNILSADEQLMSTSLPDYRLYIDFCPGDSITFDSLFNNNMDSICNGLSEIIPNWTAQQFKERFVEQLSKPRKKRSRYFPLYTRHITYIQLNDVKKLPLFNEKNKNVSGLVIQERNDRKKPFGSLAKRTLGEMYGAKDSARSGLELAYDSILRGQNGWQHRKKVRNRYLGIVDIPPVDGCDLVTTLDVSMQDICESALREKMRELNASMGVVVLMEVQTGDVKAIVNLQQYDDGEFYEARNYALASLMEPGSTFKTASIMVALDDGYITLKDKVNTCGGRYPMYKAVMKDHNWRSGGYGVLDVPEVLMYSSNIGVSRLIDEHYHKQPEKFVDGLYRIGIGTPLNLPFVGSANPVIRRPTKDNWPATTLPWMSIGYETQIPPISTCAFYNAIANNGKMVKPRFVKAVQKDGKVIREFPVEVIKEHICKESTLKDMQWMLERVVSKGLGKRAGNPHFHVSGKTGTAQVSQGRAGYLSGKREYLVSFCGYYPSENPRYTCLVAIRKPNAPASGGLMAGTVFSKIAQRVYARNITTDMSQARDSLSQFVPDVKNGDLNAAKDILADLGLQSTDQGATNIAWGNATLDNNKLVFTTSTDEEGKMPDLRGMGARDAVYAVERRGLKAKVKGAGKVLSQSLPVGSSYNKGQTVVLNLGI